MRIIKIIVLISILVVTPLLISAQSKGLVFHPLTNETGLSEATNFYTYQDSKGFVWISSVKGLNRYDGKNVKVYAPVARDGLSLLGQNIQGRFFEDAECNIWFCTYEAIHCYIRKDDNFQPLRAEDTQGTLITAGYYAVGLQDNSFYALAAGKGLLQYDIKRHQYKSIDTLFSEANRAFPVFDKKGQLTKVLAYRINNNGFQITDLNNGKVIARDFLYSKLNNDLKLYDVLHQSDTALWLSTSKGLGLFSLKNNRISQFFKPIGYQDFYVYCATTLPDGSLGLASEYGVWIFNPISKRFTNHYQSQFGYAHTLRQSLIENIFCDRSGTIWATIHANGLDFASYPKNKFKQVYPSMYDRDTVLPTNVYALCRDANGNALAAWGNLPNGNQNFLQKREVYTHWKPLTTLADKDIYLYNLLKDRKGRIWTISADNKNTGVLHKDGRFQKIKAPEGLYYFLELSDGTILVSSHDSGIYSLQEPNQWNPLKVTDSIKVATVMYEDWQNRLFVNTNYYDIQILEKRPNGYHSIQKDVIGAIVYAFLEDVQYIWMASDAGLYRYLKSTLKLERISTGDPSTDQLAFYSVFADKKGNLWLSSNKGILRYNIANNKFRRYTVADGLQGLEFNPFAAFQTPKGEIWMGGKNGINVFHPDSIQDLQVPARPAIIKISINDKEASDLRCASTGAKNVSEIKQLILPFSKNTVSFDVVANEFSDPGSNLFQYKLAGYDANWVDNGTQGFIRYARLPAGTYKLLVKAANSDGVWNGQPIQLKLVIKPPFWATWWFRLLILLILISSGWYIITTYYRRREKLIRMELEKQLAVERVRNRIAQDMHDDLGSQLSAFSLLLEKMQNASNKEHSEKELNQLLKSSRDINANLREIIWTVNTQHDTLEQFMTYLQRYAIHWFEPLLIKCSVVLPMDMPDRVIAGGIRRMILLSFKETLNNIAKHAHATEVRIQFTALSNDKILLTIEDNGKGFDNDTITPGNGLRNMAERLSGIGGDCTINTSPNGTIVRFEISLSA